MTNRKDKRLIKALIQVNIVTHILIFDINYKAEDIEITNNVHIDKNLIKSFNKKRLHFIKNMILFL